MGLKLYNTLTNKIEEFKEIEKGKVGMYMCGPTVYDHAHIGNFRSNTFQDLLKRYLIYLGYEVKHVMNITDIDDKTINKSIEQGVSLKEISEKYTKSFFEDLEALNILKADVYPRATEHIEEMKGMVSKLIEKDFAYEKGGSVYFNIEKFDNYGKLANIQKESLRMGVSVEKDEYDKNNIQDFVLWKGKKEKEPFWKTDFGEGRPGWHIECSAMSTKYLGNHFDIHVGGIDLIFPHHENEIAQSECSTNEKFVNYWVHCQHLIVDNKKMSKSLNNFYTLKDLIKKGYDPMEIRYLLISSHYRKLLNFTFDGLLAARKSLKRIKEFLFILKGLKPKDGISANISEIIEKSESDFKEYMNDDLNISGGLGVLFEFMHSINRETDNLKTEDIKNILDYMGRLNSVIGVIREEKKTDELGERVERLIEERNKARREKNYALSDKIRDELKADGIILIDTADGTRWKIEE